MEILKLAFALSGIIGVAYYLYSRYNEMINTLRASLSKLKVTLNYDDIPKVVHIEQILAYYNFGFKLITANIALAGLILLLFYSKTSIRFSSDTPAVQASFSSMWGSQTEVYDIQWQQKNDLYGEWQWRRFDGKNEFGQPAYGSWKKVNLRRLNNN